MACSNEVKDEARLQLTCFTYVTDSNQRLQTVDNKTQQQQTDAETKAAIMTRLCIFEMKKKDIKRGYLSTAW